MPEWVGLDSKGYKGIDTKGIEATAMLVASIQALKAENDELKAQMNALAQARRPVVLPRTPDEGGRHVFDPVL